MYDGHHAVHQPRRMSPYELQHGAINGHGQKFYAMARHHEAAARRGIVYYTTIRYWGKKMIREWWKDEENRAYVDWLRGQLYAEARAARARGRSRPWACRPPLLQDTCSASSLQRFLGELGVTVDAAGRGGGRGRDDPSPRGHRLPHHAHRQARRAGQAKDFYTHLASASEAAAHAVGQAPEGRASR